VLGLPLQWLRKHPLQLKGNAMKRIFLSLLLTSFALGQAQAQSGVGAVYGTRDPAVCKSKKEPAKGAPSPEQAIQYFKCEREKGVDSQSNIYLYENVKLEIGKGRPYNVSDMNLSDIDSSLPVYPIRGSFDVYQCKDPKHMLSNQNPGKNCSVNENVQGKGVCYKTTFGDWSCIMGYDVDFRSTKRGVPGPK
jgi:hypothetical protein